MYICIYVYMYKYRAKHAMKMVRSRAPGRPHVFKLRAHIGYCPHPETVYIRVLLRAIHNPIISIIQLLLRGDSTQGIYLQ